MYLYRELMPTQFAIDARTNSDDLNNVGSWPLSMKCSFIEPGVVNYADVGMVFVGKEVLDKMANSMIGRPVINEEHRDVSAEDFKNGTAQGIVNSVWFDSKDAMFHAAYQVWDQPTLKNIKGGYKVSCAYKVTRWGSGGIHNNVPYEREVLDGEYTHLAIVANPRYEGVRIYNDKGAKTMTLKWIKKLISDGKEVENSTDIDSSKSVVEIDGKQVAMDNLINAFKDQEEKKRKELENQAPADTDLIDIGGGKKVSVADLKNAYVAKNADDDDEDKKKKAKEMADDEERKNAAAAAAELQIKNDMEKEHKDGKHKESDKDNCGMCNDLKERRNKSHFKKVEDLANNRDGDDLVNELTERPNAFEEGRKRFGSELATAAKK